MLKKVTNIFRTFLLFTLVTVLLCLLARQAWAAPYSMPSGFQATVLANSNMTAPAAIEIAPDGRIFVLDLTGSIKIFKNGAWNSQPFATIAVDATGDKGLLGGIFDQNFPSQPYFYIHYVGTDKKVRIGKYTVSGDTGTNFTILWNL
jgi:hypothetical protein